MRKTIAKEFEDEKSYDRYKGRNAHSEKVIQIPPTEKKLVPGIGDHVPLIGERTQAPGEIDRGIGSQVVKPEIGSKNNKYKKERVEDLISKVEPGILFIFRFFCLSLFDLCHLLLTNLKLCTSGNICLSVLWCVAFFLMIFCLNIYRPYVVLTFNPIEYILNGNHR